MQKQSKTFSGLVSNLMDQSDALPADGLMAARALSMYLKGRLQSLLDTSNDMAADGSLQQLDRADRKGPGYGAFQFAERAARTLWPISCGLGRRGAVPGGSHAVENAAGRAWRWRSAQPTQPSSWAPSRLIAGAIPVAPAVAALGTAVLAGLMGEAVGLRRRRQGHHPGSGGADAQDTGDRRGGRGRSWSCLQVLGAHQGLFKRRLGGPYRGFTAPSSWPLNRCLLRSARGSRR